MTELQLSHIALVGARMECFKPYGFFSREELTMCRVVPEPPRTRPTSLRKQLRTELPIWIHNIISDPDFPLRNHLLMPLRRFEGELRDHRNNEVISTVLQYGLNSQSLNPLELPESMPMRQRCAMVVHLDSWREAYCCLEEELVEILAKNIDALGRWCDFARQDTQAEAG